MKIIEFLAKFFSAIITLFGVVFIVFKAGEKNGEKKQINKDLENDIKFYKDASKVKDNISKLGDAELADILQK